MPVLHAAILAAGRSQRFGAPKMLAQIDGEPMLRSIVATVRSVLGEHHDIVLGPQASALRLVDACKLDPAHVRYNEDAALGLSSSLKLAVELAPESAAGLLIVLGDQPGVSAQDLRELIALWESSPQVPAAAAYGDTLGAPCILPRALFAAVKDLQGDRGAQALLRALPKINTLAMPLAAHDIDTPADLERWQHRSKISI